MDKLEMKTEKSFKKVFKAQLFILLQVIKYYI